MGEGGGSGRERPEVIVDTAISPFCVMAPDGTVRWASRSIEELLGHSAEEMVGRSMADLLAPSSLERAIDMMQRFQERGHRSASWRGSGILVDVIHADGTPVACDVAVATPVRTGLDGFVLQLRRRGSAAHLQHALTAMAENQPLARVLTAVAAALSADVAGARTEVHWDWDGTQFGGCAANDGLSLLADDTIDDDGERPWVDVLSTGRGVDLDDLGRLPARVARWADRLGMRALWVQPVARAGAEHPGAVVAVWRSGDVDPSMFPNYETDRLCALVGVALEWDRGRTSLRLAADSDPLTGLANRRTLLERLRSPMAVGAAGTVLFCDVDDFKPVNDEHGHGSGDAVLQVIGERLRKAVRPSDLVARYGGDEFVVHCPGTTDRSVVDELVERLERVTAAPITIGSMTVRVGLSVGSWSIDEGADVDDVLAAAAREMGRVKRDRKEACGS